MNKKKIIIFGLPGSGKSYFAKCLHQITNIELIHLDNLLVDKNTKRINIKHLEVTLKELLEKEEGIIEGYYPYNLKERLDWCDICYFFDLSKEEVYEGLKERINVESDDCPFIRSEDELEEFENHYQLYIKEKKPRLIELINNYKDIKIITFHSRKEVNDYLKELE